MKKWIQTIKSFNFSVFYYNQRYKILTFLDPPPKYKKGELAVDYFDRMHPKYAVRYYQTMLGIIPDINLATSLATINERYKDKRSKELLKRLALTMVTLSQTNREMLKRYTAKYLALKNQN